MTVQNLKAIVKKNEELPRTLGTQSFKSRASHWKTKTKVYFLSHAQNIVCKTHQVYNPLSNPKQTYPYSCRKVKYCFETHTTYCSTYRIRERLELNLIIHLISMPRELPSKILAFLQLPTNMGFFSVYFMTTYLGGTQINGKVERKQM